MSATGSTRVDRQQVIGRTGS